MSIWVKIIGVLALLAAIGYGVVFAVGKVEQSGFNRCVAAEAETDEQDKKDADKTAKEAKDASTKVANELKAARARNSQLEREVKALRNEDLKGNKNDSGEVSDTFRDEWNRIVNRRITDPKPAAASSAAGAPK